MNNIDKKRLERQYLWKFVTIGHLKDEPDTRYDGRSGQVEYIDDKGLLHGTWGGLAIIPDVDDFEVNYQIAENEEFINESDEKETKDASVGKDKKEPKTADFKDPYMIKLSIMKNIDQILKGCGCKIKNGKSSTLIITKDFDQAIQIINKLKDTISKRLLSGDNNQSIILTKISKSQLNDSINEAEAFIEERRPTNECFGDFLTEYIFSEDDATRLNDTLFDFDEDGSVVTRRQSNRDLIELNAAKNHVRAMTKAGIEVNIVPGRWSTKLYIHWEGKKQYDLFKCWLAWHLGYTDVMVKKLSKDTEDEIAPIIASGSSTIY